MATATAEPRTRKPKQVEQPSQVIDQPQQKTEVARIEYPVAMTVITDLQERYSGLTIAGIDDKAGLLAVDEARKEVKRLKIQVENRRKELKADALEYGRKVDAAAKTLSEPLEALEALLAGRQKVITDELARIEQQRADELYASRRDQLAAYGAEVPERILRIMREDEFDSALTAAKTAHEDKQRRDAEQARLDADRKKLEDERAELERIRQAQADKDAEAQRKIDEENERLAAQAQEKVNGRIREVMLCHADPTQFDLANMPEAEFVELIERLSQEDAARIQREADEAAARREQQRKDDEAAEEKRRLRIEALRPDKEKLLSFAKTVAAMEVPEVGTDARLTRSLILNRLATCATDIEKLVEERLK